ncbi:DUF4199 domain-containing protein [Algibacter aquimarinus]|uniref:DUF4199 domain-containing protein n=1 Tax=Algibacter aquimarinus TaxID=1136748 RepID=A0ABP9H3E2_9FLAO
MEKSLKFIAKDFGLYLGGTLTIIMILAYAFNLNLFVNFWYGISIYLITIAFGIIAVIKTKVNFDGILSFKNAFTSYFITISIGLSLSSLASYILFNFIDTNAADALKEKSIEKMIEVFKTMKKPDEEIQSSIKMAESGNLYSISNVFKGLIFNYLVPLSIVGLLVAAAMQKNKPDTK